MENLPRSKKFWTGNAVLVVALLILLKMDALSELIGFNAMILWICVVGCGVWLLMTDQNAPPSNPD